MKKIKIIVPFLVFVCCLAHSSSAQDDSQNKSQLNRAPLKQVPYQILPLGSVQPEGWLKEQLIRMADGLTGKLGEIYPNVGESNAWRGGNGDVWERGPYWLDGLVPLAYTLDDQELINKAKPFIEWTLNSQREDGFFGPSADDVYTDKRGFQTGNVEDWWPRMVMLKALQNYYEATGDERVIKFMTNYFRYQQEQLAKKPIGHWTWWSERRGGENQASIYWLYNKTGDEFLLDLAQIVYAQTTDWTRIFADKPDRRHVVNTAMGIKQPAIQYLQTKDERHLDAIDIGLKHLMEEHGQVQGMFSGDEILHGTNPTHGTELCAIVEFMYSLENLVEITGRVDYADRLEKVAFNALPAQTTDNFMGRQYYQQPNQIIVDEGVGRKRNFITQHSLTETCFGLNNGYPCCTTNMHQGWPKFVKSLWMKTNDGGLAAMVYGPNSVDTEVNGVRVKINEQTNYPFENTIRFEISAGEIVEFPLHLRIPSWASGAEVRVNGKVEQYPENGSIAKIRRQWREGDTVELNLPMEFTTSRWHENSLGIERGPLVYALKVDGKREKIDEEHGVPTWGFQPTTPWNYGLLINPQNPSDDLELTEKETPDYPWNAESVPLKVTAKGKKIPKWTEYNGNHGPIPHSKVKSDEKTEEITLIPYGATILRISEIPQIRDN